MPRIVKCLLSLLALLLASAAIHANAEEKNADELAFRIENSKCYVGVAQVRLSVGTLTQIDGKLVGDYEIEVPLKKSKNDRGRIELDIDQCFIQIGEKGGTLRGFAFSEKAGNENKPPSVVVCKIGPLTDKLIELAITTTRRTLNFHSSYKLVEHSKDS